MVPDYEDDDIVEDYEEVTSDSARRVASGGPVQRPAGRPAGRPATTSAPALSQNDSDMQLPPKGKISKSSAKLIWIICIGVSLLGVAAVLVDLFLDPLKRHVAVDDGGAPAANNTRTNRPTRENLSPVQQAQMDFKKAVINQMVAMDQSKAWDFYWLAYLEFDDAYGSAVTLKKKEGVTTAELEEAWALAIKHYYKARYASELFEERFDKDKASLDWMPISIEGDDLSALTSENDLKLMKEARIQAYQAAYSKLDSKSVSIKLFQTDVLKNELVAGNVHTSDEWKAKVFGEYRALHEGATKGQFAQADLDFVNGPDYQQGEQKLFEAYLAKKGG